MILFKSNDQTKARLGLVVPKRTVNKAVSRNQIKRIVRESFRLHQERLGGFDIVFITRHHADKLDKKALRKGIDELWEKLLSLSSKS